MLFNISEITEHSNCGAGDVVLFENQVLRGCESIRTIITPQGNLTSDHQYFGHWMFIQENFLFVLSDDMIHIYESRPNQPWSLKCEHPIQDELYGSQLLYHPSGSLLLSRVFMKGPHDEPEAGALDILTVDLDTCLFGEIMRYYSPFPHAYGHYSFATSFNNDALVLSAPGEPAGGKVYVYPSFTNLLDMQVLTFEDLEIVPDWKSDPRLGLSNTWINEQTLLISGMYQNSTLLQEEGFAFRCNVNTRAITCSRYDLDIMDRGTESFAGTNAYVSFYHDEYCNRIPLDIFSSREELFIYRSKIRYDYIDFKMPNIDRILTGNDRLYVYDDWFGVLKSIPQTSCEPKPDDDSTQEEIMEILLVILTVFLILIGIGLLILWKRQSKPKQYIHVEKEP